MITIDGKEGGGQLLRTSLLLSVITGKPFRLINIRGARDVPGLRAQHLTCIKAMLFITSGSTCEGAALGSREIAFVPGSVSHANEFEFDIGTAGSVALLLQCLAPAIAISKRDRGDPCPVTLTLRGGTHVSFAPLYEDISESWVPMMKRFGFGIALNLEQAGFYPRGGGAIRAVISPCATLDSTLISWATRPALARIRIVSGVANASSRHQQSKSKGKVKVKHASQPVSDGDALLTAEQNGQLVKKALRTTLRVSGVDVNSVSSSIEPVVYRAASPGQSVVLCCEFEGDDLCPTTFQSLGGDFDAAIGHCAEFVRHRYATVGAKLADQVLVPAVLVALDSSSSSSSRPTTTRLVTPSVTVHLTTHIDLLRSFTDVLISVAVDADGHASVDVAPPGAV
ncbi:RNA 3'-terminal phosphate cyclase [Ramicandelaber brevisporus]|nr:RNA 3'-terminal phosphate cyclase [Ramicandelaber brevisporus]